MTKAEFMSKYGKAEVVFDSYYKYTFSFKGNLPDGKTIIIQVGGDSDDIYKLDVVVGQIEIVEKLHPAAGGIYDGKTLLEEFNEW